MREIKFRAWDDSNKEFHPSDSLMNWTYADIINDAEDEFTIEQFTGLKDKNGVEIYEGDIIEVSMSNPFCGDYMVRFEIVWGQKGSWHPSPSTHDNLSECIHNMSGKNISKVIGNIHEKTSK